MTTIYLWQHAPLADRLNIYNKYTSINTKLDFEEFDQLYYNHSFHSVAAAFGV